MCNLVCSTKCYEVKQLLKSEISDTNEFSYIVICRLSDRYEGLVLRGESLHEASLHWEVLVA